MDTKSKLPVCCVTSGTTYIYDNNGNLKEMIEGISDLSMTCDVVNAKSGESTLLSHESSKNIKYNGEQATREEILNRLGDQMKSREADLTRYNEKLKIQEESIIELLKTIFNRKGKKCKKLLDIVCKENKGIYQSFISKYKYCEECKKYVEYHIDDDDFTYCKECDEIIED